MYPNYLSEWPLILLGLLGLDDLRAKVREESTRNKFQVDADADAGQGFSFTPPHAGKILNPIELTWSADKSNYNKTPAADRSKDRACVDLLLTCMLQQRDVSEFIRLSGSYTHACLRSARDFVQETQILSFL